mmetsp:Transcript_14033/g.32370  ORF Transcript_14033/g.32370 Transcript_14033/m.32370 type:complete len:268 (-) Transcript_14033:77-880(-)
MVGGILRHTPELHRGWETQDAALLFAGPPLRIERARRSHHHRGQHQRWRRRRIRAFQEEETQGKKEQKERGFVLVDHRHPTGHRHQARIPHRRVADPKNRALQDHRRGNRNPTAGTPRPHGRGTGRRDDRRRRVLGLYQGGRPEGPGVHPRCRPRRQARRLHPRRRCFGEKTLPNDLQRGPVEAGDCPSHQVRGGRRLGRRPEGGQGRGDAVPDHLHGEHDGGRLLRDGCRREGSRPGQQRESRHPRGDLWSAEGGLCFCGQRKRWR